MSEATAEMTRLRQQVAAKQDEVEAVQAELAMLSTKATSPKKTAVRPKPAPMPSAKSSFSVKTSNPKLASELAS